MTRKFLSLIRMHGAKEIDSSHPSSFRHSPEISSVETLSYSPAGDSHPSAGSKGGRADTEYSSTWIDDDLHLALLVLEVIDGGLDAHHSERCSPVSLLRELRLRTGKTATRGFPCNKTNRGVEQHTSCGASFLSFSLSLTVSPSCPPFFAGPRPFVGMRGGSFLRVCLLVQISTSFRK